MGIAENIKKRRIELRMSQQELADAMGYRSRSTIAKIEAGENAVPASKIPRFARVLETTAEYIKTGFAGEANAARAASAVYGTDAPRRIAAVILAGGKSTRNMQNIPNQFINVLGKPVIMYCAEAYQRHPSVTDIYIVCLKGWEDIVAAYAKQYGIDKLRGIITGGDTGIRSVRKAVDALRGNHDGTDVIIFQESTRPLITEEMISKLLNACLRNGSAVTCEPMVDYLPFELTSEEPEDSVHAKYLNRFRVVTAQSPEAYRLSAVLEAFKRADEQNHRYDETCFAMLLYRLGYELQFFEGNHYNIKVVRQEDIAILNALLKNRI